MPNYRAPNDHAEPVERMTDYLDMFKDGWRKQPGIYPRWYWHRQLIYHDGRLASGVVSCLHWVFPSRGRRRGRLHPSSCSGPPRDFDRSSYWVRSWQRFGRSTLEPYNFLLYRSASASAVYGDCEARGCLLGDPLPLLPYDLRLSHACR